VEIPLELTRDMRLDEEENEATVTPAAIDPDQLRGMVRDVVLEQLESDQASDLIRNVLKEELMNGEIGANMSQNVMSLIQAEVAKALKG
ncbi:MAG: hypothetical protein AB8B85_00725, partial [Paracoccaceae bacterium]